MPETTSTGPEIVHVFTGIDRQLTLIDEELTQLKDRLTRRDESSLATRMQSREDWHRLSRSWRELEARVELLADGLALLVARIQKLEAGR